MLRPSTSPQQLWQRWGLKAVQAAIAQICQHGLHPLTTPPHLHPMPPAWQTGQTGTMHHLHWRRGDKLSVLAELEYIISMHKHNTGMIQNAPTFICHWAFTWEIEFDLQKSCSAPKLTTTSDEHRQNETNKSLTNSCTHNSIPSDMMILFIP